MYTLTDMQTAVNVTKSGYKGQTCVWNVFHSADMTSVGQTHVVEHEE